MASRVRLSTLPADGSSLRRSASVRRGVTALASRRIEWPPTTSRCTRPVLADARVAYDLRAVPPLRRAPVSPSGPDRAGAGAVPRHVLGWHGGAGRCDRLGAWAKGQPR